MPRAVIDTSARTISWVLIVPGIAAALRPIDAPADLPQLGLLAGRGSIDIAWDRADLAAAGLNSWQRGLLASLQLLAPQYPSAAVSVLADLPNTAGYWLHAEPVHLAAGLDQLAFLPLTGSAVVTPGERSELVPIFDAHLLATGLRLQVSARQWFIHSSRVLDVITAAPDAAAANELPTVMPRGSDAGELRRMMTEWQMLLHEHPVNERRQRRGLPEINAVWPWGGGVLPSLSPRSLPLAFGGEAFLRGLYASHGAAVHALPANAEVLLAHVPKSSQCIVVAPMDDPGILDRDWIEPLLQALRAGRIQRLEVILDQWRLYATRGMLRRLWRKPLPPSGWPS